MKDKKQGKVEDGVFIRPLIDLGVYEMLKDESDRRKISMNMIVRESLRKRYELD